MRKNIPARFREWVAEILRHSAILGWAAEHFEGDSRNLAGIFYTTLYRERVSERVSNERKDPLIDNSPIDPNSRRQLVYLSFHVKSKITYPVQIQFTVE